MFTSKIAHKFMYEKTVCVKRTDGEFVFGTYLNICSLFDGRTYMIVETADATWPNVFKQILIPTELIKQIEIYGITESSFAKKEEENAI